MRPAIIMAEKARDDLLGLPAVTRRLALAELSQAVSQAEDVGAATAWLGSTPRHYHLAKLGTTGYTAVYRRLDDDEVGRHQPVLKSHVADSVLAVLAIVPTEELGDANE
jgi:hypothetical protein